MSKVVEKSKVEPKLVIFELVDKRETSFIRENSNGSAEDRLDSARIRVTPPNISVRVGPNGMFERVQYIKGCPELSVEKQRAKGIFPNALGSDKIEFKFGKLILVDSGDDAILISYLRCIVLNEENSEKKPGVTPIFRELKKEEDAKDALDKYFLETKAKELIDGCIYKQGDKYVFDKPKIDFYCKAIGGFDEIASYEYNQKANALIQFSKTNPKVFIERVTSEVAGVTVTLKQAIEKRVVEFDNKSLFFVGGKVICTVSSDDTTKMIDEAVEYLMKGTSLGVYNQIQESLKDATE